MNLRWLLVPNLAPYTEGVGKTEEKADHFRLVGGRFNLQKPPQEAGHGRPEEK